jgi:ketosteroid isomerase-like protein
MSARELVQAGLAAYNTRDSEAMRKLYRPDATITNPDSPDPMSVDEMIGGFGIALSAFPDARLTLTSVVVEGDNVAFEMRWTGTHQGPLELPDGSELPPTERTVSFPVAVMLETREGLIVRERQYYDNLAILDQLGVA